MAAAGDDGSDDDDEAGRRGSAASKMPGAPVKSLKGKETFKTRLPSREEMSRQIAKARDGRRRTKTRPSRRLRENGERKTFVEGLMTDSEEDSASDDSAKDADRKRRRKTDDRPDEGVSSISGLVAHRGSTDSRARRDCTTL